MSQLSEIKPGDIVSIRTNKDYLYSCPHFHALVHEVEENHYLRSRKWTVISSITDGKRQKTINRQIVTQDGLFRDDGTITVKKIKHSRFISRR